MTSTKMMMTRVGNNEDLEDEWASFAPSPESTIPSSPPPSHPPLFPSATGKVQFGTTTTTTVDESVVSNASDATKPEAEAEKDTPLEEKSKRRADLDVMAKFGERQAKRMDLRDVKR